MSYVWLTADKHHGHNQEFLFKERNVKDLHDMDWTLINNHNERVKPEDIVMHIGDFCFTSGNNSKLKYYEWEDQLNGKIIHILGNHDKQNKIKGALNTATYQFEGLNFFMRHIPPENESEIPEGIDIFVCGHVHTLWKSKWVKKLDKDVFIVNVGVDVWNLRPVRIDELTKYYKSERRKLK